MKRKIIFGLFFMSIVGHAHAMHKRKSSSRVERRRTGVPELSLNTLIFQKDLKRMNELGISPRTFTHQQITRILAQWAYGTLRGNLYIEDFDRASKFRNKSFIRKSPLVPVKNHS